MYFLFSAILSLCLKWQHILCLRVTNLYLLQLPHPPNIQEQLNFSLTNIMTFLSFQTAACMLVRRILQLFKHLNTFPCASLCASVHISVHKHDVLKSRELNFPCGLKLYSTWYCQLSLSFSAGCVCLFVCLY